MSGKAIRLNQIKKGDQLTPETFNNALDRTARAVDDLDARIDQTTKKATIHDLGSFSGSAEIPNTQADGFVTYVLDGTRKFAIIHNGELNQL